MGNEIIMPNHVGIIMDGNGRWATEKGKKRSYGHLCGYNNLIDLSLYIFDKGVKVLSIFAFSTENFKRSDDEVNYLMGLFIKMFAKDFKIIKEKKIKLVFSGQKDYPLSLEIIKDMKIMEEETKDNTRGTFNVCFNYGGQTEIIDATKKIVADVINKKINIEDLDIEMYPKYLYNDLPPIDLLIRTSGELRISNFMLWQIAYAECYFPETYFPDFNHDEFDKAVILFNERDRRFGGSKSK